MNSIKLNEKHIDWFGYDTIYCDEGCNCNFCQYYHKYVVLCQSDHLPSKFAFNLMSFKRGCWVIPAGSGMHRPQEDYNNDNFMIDTYLKTFKIFCLLKIIILNVKIIFIKSFFKFFIKSFLNQYN